MTAPDTNAIREAITEHWGPRCRTLDTEDFPELVALGEGRCPACRAWEQLDALCDALDDAKAENERLRAALAPFSEESAYWFSHNYNREDRPVEGFQGYTPVMTCGDLFNARAALAQKGGA